MSSNEYFKAWQQQFDGTEAPPLLALAGGTLAHQMSDVFASGYQAAIRAVFPQCAGRHWYAFCVSEGSNGLPATTSESDSDATRVNGAKTWVACADVIARVIVKVNRGAQAFYVDWPVDREGVSLQTGEPARFLPHMNQGIIHFDRVEVASDDVMDASRVRLFGVLESLYIYLAFVGFARHLGIEAEGLADRLTDILKSEDVSAEGLAAMAAIDTEIQALLQRLASECQALPDNFVQDQRLIAMYSPMIQKRVSN